MPLLEKLPGHPASNDSILDAFLDYLTSENITPYDHQEEAILELFSGKNVILNTPTGSGKSLVALALHYRALCQGRRSYYTVPVKALANEKFLTLCDIFGAAQVGLVTGDATVNAGAPIICCTAEILANIALREGSAAAIDDVIIDEFHYYSDHSRGSAWQIPLLTLPRALFLLMSATLGDTTFFEKELTTLTGAPTSLVRSPDRPVPLIFEYSETTLEERVAKLVETERAPVYLVHFTQLACARSAQNLLSTNFCTPEEKREITEALQGADFRSPYGKEVAKLLRHGIGIHHAGLLPKYRVLVEKLTQKGLLKVVCGTDTLGVGVNVPIRTVLFTQLCKFDGQGTKILTVRDFQQICGRAGRKGFDDVGYVISQAPEHVIQNLRLEAKAAANSGKKKKFVKKKPPEKGFIAWDKNTFQKLIDSTPEALISRFSITQGLLLNILSRREEDGCAALRALINASHEPPKRKKKLRRQAFHHFRGLVHGGVLDIIPPQKRTSPAKVTLNVNLQEDFSINHALGLYLLDTLPKLDADAPNYPLDLLSLIEAIVENPTTILQKQVRLLRDQRMVELKREGVEYEERLLQLEEIEWPKPGKDFIYDTFNRFAATHPWAYEYPVRPKSVAREMFEKYQSFEDYIKTYGLERSEGVLLRHLSEVYKVLAQTIPPAVKTGEVAEAELYFEHLLGNIDSSLLDEWKTLRNPDYTPDKTTPPKSQKTAPITADKKIFTRLIRLTTLDFLKHLAHKNWADALALVHPESPSREPWTTVKIETIITTYQETHDRIRLDPEARNARHTHIDDQHANDQWRIAQTLIDPGELNDWTVCFIIDLPKSKETGKPVLLLESIAPIH